MPPEEFTVSRPRILAVFLLLGAAFFGVLFGLHLPALEAAHARTGTTCVVVKVQQQQAGERYTVWWQYRNATTRDDPAPYNDTRTVDGRPPPLGATAPCWYNAATGQELSFDTGAEATETTRALASISGFLFALAALALPCATEEESRRGRAVAPSSPMPVRPRVVIEVVLPPLVPVVPTGGPALSVSQSFGLSMMTGSFINSHSP